MGGQLKLNFCEDDQKLPAAGQVLEMDIITIDVVRDQIDGERRPFVVGVVLEDPPTNTQLQFDALASLLSVPDEQLNQVMNFFATYLLLNEPPDQALVEKISSLAAGKVADVSLWEYHGKIIGVVEDFHFGVGCLPCCEHTETSQNRTLLSGVGCQLLALV